MANKEALRELQSRLAEKLKAARTKNRRVVIVLGFRIAAPGDAEEFEGLRIILVRMDKERLAFELEEDVPFIVDRRIESALVQEIQDRFRFRM